MFNHFKYIYPILEVTQRGKKLQQNMCMSAKHTVSQHSTSSLNNMHPNHSCIASDTHNHTSAYMTWHIYKHTLAHSHKYSHHTDLHIFALTKKASNNLTLL